MPGTSPEGWPYILDDDHPMEYPAYSQSLATLMDSRWDTYQSTGLVLPFTGWSDRAASYAGLWVTKHQGMVTAEMSLQTTGSLAVTSGQWYQCGTIPAGFRPAHDLAVAVPGLLTTYGTFIARVRTTGALEVFASSTATWPVSNWIGVNATYRQGN